MTLRNRYNDWVATRPLKQQWLIVAGTAWLSMFLVFSLVLWVIVAAIGLVIDLAWFWNLLPFAAGAYMATLGVWSERKQFVPEDGL